MLYFRNTELAIKFHVNPTTVRNWIDAAHEGKLGIALHTERGRTYIANTAANIVAIERLVAENRKYRNTKAVKVITPSASFYRLYSQDQIYDIVSSLQIHHEIPREYNYFDGGAGNWDLYTQRLAEEDSPNTLNSTLELLKRNEGYIDSLLMRYKRINVVDLGVGNALPIRDLLAHLLKRKVLGRYIAIDISAEMLEIARRNITEWFGDKVVFEGHERDIKYDRFANLLADEYIKTKDAANLVLLLGATLLNFRDPDGTLRVIHDSLGLDDYLLHTTKLDTETSRRYFDFNLQPGYSALAPNHRFIFDHLNINESLYDVEMGYDDHKRERYIRVRLSLDPPIASSC